VLFRSAQQGFSSSELLDISRQVCRGLDHAHSKGIFHRRLTPPGILTKWDGTVKILDFAAELGPLQTRTGDDLRYLSPEQVQGQTPDARSNVFSWGAILYEMVTGRKAFGESDAAGVQSEIMEVMPQPPQEVIPRMPAGISRVIMKALAKNPESRFQHAGDLARELESEVEAECGAASEAAPPDAPQVNVPPPAPLPPRTETGSPIVAGLAPKLGSDSFTSVASGAAALASPAEPSTPCSEPLPGYDIPAPTAPSCSPAMAATAVAAPSPSRETTAPLPPAPRTVAASSQASLTPQIKILVGVAAAALLVMVIVVIVMVGDGIRPRRLQAEAEAAATAPLIGTASPDPITTAPPLPPPEPEPQPTATEMVPTTKSGKGRHKAVVAPVALAVGELAINSVPEGAQVQVDGSVAGLTPVSLNSLSAGQHLVVVSKAGYAAETRSVMVQRATRTALAVSLNQLAAVASVASAPPGASIIIDGRDTGKVTPAKLVVGQGSHALALRKPGYLETPANMTPSPGETFQFPPTLKPLGNADDIKQVGKFKKLIGRSGQENAARVMVSTLPKGAQIMFNSRMMDRRSPAEFLLGPGTYEVTLTLTGYKTVRKVITVESNGRIEVNETFER